MFCLDPSFENCRNDTKTNKKTAHVDDDQRVFPFKKWIWLMKLINFTHTHAHSASTSFVLALARSSQINGKNLCKKLMKSFEK